MRAFITSFMLFSCCGRKILSLDHAWKYSWWSLVSISALSLNIIIIVGDVFGDSGFGLG